jgi:hypothetical protein
LVCGYFLWIDRILIAEDPKSTNFQHLLLQAGADIEGKIIVEAGSNTHYGIDAMQLEKAFNRFSVNLGDWAAYPMAHKLRLLKPYLHPGDTVVVPLEWQHYVRGKTFPGVYARSLMNGKNRYYYHELPLWQRVEFVFRHIPQRVLKAHVEGKNPKDRLSHAPLTEQIAQAKTRLIDNRGNSTDHEKDQSLAHAKPVDSCDDYIFRITRLSGFKLSRAYREDLRTIARLQKETGAKFVLAWPNVVSPNDTPCYSSEDVSAELPTYTAKLKQAAAEYGLSYLGEPTDSRFPKECYLDTPYHLNRQCEIQRTERLIAALKTNGLTPLKPARDYNQTLIQQLDSLL